MRPITIHRTTSVCWVQFLFMSIRRFIQDGMLISEISSVDDLKRLSRFASAGKLSFVHLISIYTEKIIQLKFIYYKINNCN